MTFDPSSAQPDTGFDPNSAVPDAAPPLRAVLKTAVTEQPDHIAEAQRLAKRYPAPVDSIVRNMDDYRLFAITDDIETSLKGSPKLRTAMHDPALARVAHDDILKLTQIEAAVQAYGELKSWEGPAPSTSSIISGLAKSLPQFGREFKAGMSMQMGDALEAMGLIKRSPTFMADQVRKLQQAQGAADYTKPNIESTTGAAVYSGAESFLRAIPGVAMSVATRSPTPAMIAIGLQTEGEAYGKYRARGGTPGEALTGALGESLVEVLTEYIPGKYVAESLGKTGAKEFVLSLVKKEVLGEQAATILQDAIDTAIANPDKTWDQYIAERPEAAYQTLVATLTQAGMMSGVNTAVRKIAEMSDQSAEVQRQADVLAEQLKAAGSSLLRERSPEQFRELMKSMTDGKIYVDGEVLNQLPPDQIAALPQAVQDQIATAAATGDVVEVSVADALTIAPGTPLEQMLVENARTDPFSMSPAEAKQAGEKAGELLKQEAERVIQQAADQDALRTSQEVVKANIKQQLETTGRFRDTVNEGYATWAAAFYTAYGSRVGMTPEQFYQAYPLRILAEPSNNEQAYNAPRTGRLDGIEAFNFGKSNRTTLSGSNFGNGLAGNNKDVYLNAADKRLAKRIYFYADKGTGINPEAGVGGIARKFNLDNVYDGDTDPLRLKSGRDQLGFESAVLDAGFSGYLTRMEGTQSGQVILLGDQTVTGELIGPTTKTTGKVVPPKTERPSRGRDQVGDRLRANKELPMGEMSLASWSSILQRRMPLEHDAMQAAGVFEGEGKFYKDGLLKRFESLTPAESYEQSVSTRTPSMKAGRPDAHLSTDLAVDFDALNSAPAFKAKLADVVSRYVTSKRSRASVDKRIETFVTQVRDNLLWLYDQVPAQTRERSKLWYVGGRNIVDRWVKRYDGKYTDAQMAASLAVMSPKMAWDPNVALSERVVDIYTDQQQTEWSPEMTAVADIIAEKNAGRVNIIDEVRGKKLADLKSPLQKAFWIRFYSEAHTGQNYRLVTPEGGFLPENAQTGKGAEASAAYGNGFGPIAKIVSILEDGSIPNISRQLGQAHKVRNFYNNIFDPNDPNSVTIDTHAAAAGLLLPLGASSAEVNDLFGAAGSHDATGLSGTYVLFAEAYRRAAAERGVLPREMQSITWEAVRGLFSPAFKTAYAKDSTAFDKLWFDYTHGKASLDDTRTNILGIADKITEPRWVGSGTGLHEGGWASSYKGDLLGPEPAGRDRAAGPRAGGATAAGSATLAQSAATGRATLADFTREGLPNLLSKDGWAVLTAEDPGAQKATPEANAAAMQALEADLAAIGAQWQEVIGKYGDTQKSLIVAGITEQQAADLGAKYGQESVLTREGLVYMRDGSVTPAVGMDVFDTAPEDFYTTIPGTDTFFSVQLDWGGEASGEVFNQGDLFPGEFATKRTTVETSAVIDSKGTRAKGGNTNSKGQQVTATKQGLQRFWDWFAGSEATDDKGRPLVLYHSTNNDVTQFETNRETTNNYGLLGDVTTRRAGIFLTPDLKFSQEYLRGGAGQNIMQVYAALKNPLDLRRGISESVEAELEAAGVNVRYVNNAQNVWELFDSADDGTNDFVEGLKAAGYDGAIFREDSPGGESEGGTTYVAFESAQVKSATGNDGTFDVNDPSILSQQARGTFNPKTLELVLNPNANLSTFFHETGHFFLEVMADIAGQPNAPAQIVGDMNTFLKWAGIPDLATWNAMTLDQKRAAHERWAESIEQYVMEGKAPSVELQPLMRRFATWLKSVYGSIKQFLASRGQAAPGGETLGQADAEAQADAVYSEIANDQEMIDALEVFMVSGDPPEGALNDRLLEYINRLPPVPADSYLTFYRNQPRGARPWRRGWSSWTINEDQTRFFGGRDFEVLKRKGVHGLDLNRLGEYRTRVTGEYSQYGSQGEWLVLNESVFNQDPTAPAGPQMALNDDIRRVMDRMLATDEQIKQANEVAGLMPDEAADGEANERLRKRSIADLKWAVKARDKVIAKLKKEAKAIEKATREQITAEVNAMPEVQAKDMLAKTRSENKTELNDTERAIIADAFGYESVDAMLKAIDAFGVKSEVIDGLTERRMLEEHGDLIDDRAIMDAANEAVHNEARARSLATELRTQGEMLNPRADTGQTNAKGSKITVNALVEAAKQFAANVVGKTVLRDLKAAAWKHTAAERRAAKRWNEATTAGKTEEAVKAKQDQMLNHAAAKAAIDAQSEADKIYEFFKRVTKGNDETVVEKGRDPDVVNAARAVLAAYGVQSAASKGAQAYLDTLAKNDPETHGVVKPMVDGLTQNAQPLDALTFDELQGLHEEIQAMWHLAKRSRQMEVDGNLLDIDEVADEVYARLEEIGIPDTVPGEAGALTTSEIRARQWLQQVPALLRRVEQWAEAKDGKFGGPFLRFIFQPVKDAADRYRTDRLEYRKKFQALVDAIAPSMRHELIHAPELGYVFGRGHNGIGTAELLHAILHTGNESNKRKLLLGRGWATDNGDGTIDTGRWDAFIQRMADEGKLTKVHFDFAQGVWDLMEQTKPLAQKTHRDVFGRYFAEVTADPFVDPFGVTRAGGYVPAQADPLLVQDADLRELLETENAGMAQAFPQTNKGFTQSRVEYNRPLKLDLRTLPQHIDKVLLFSHMEPAVRGVAKLLRRPKVSQPLGRVDPAAIGGMLKPWLNRAARQTVETPISGDAGLNRMASTVRARVGMSLMIANVSNTLQQITGALTAAIKVKPSLMSRAAAQFIANPKQFKQAVWGLSPYMADRASNEVAVLSDTLEEILINPSTFQKVEHWTRRHGYFLQTAFDNAMSPVIWTGAYNQALAEGQTERDAIRFADGVVRQTQGSTLPEDVSRIESGPAYARLFTQFIGYFNMMANTNATALQQIAAEQGLKKGAGKALGTLMLGLLAPIWVAEAIAHAMRGGPDDEDDDGYLDDWLAAVFGFGTIRGVLAGVPFLGAAAQSAVNRFNDQPADDKFSLSPSVSVLESAVGAPASVYKAIVDDASKQKAVRDVSALITVMTGLPAMAAARPAGYLAGVADDKIEPTGPVDAARGVITGTASPESKQR